MTVHIPAVRRKSTGFSDQPFTEVSATIVGFCHGEHADARGYGRPGETVLAIYADAEGRMNFAPVTQFRILPNRATVTHEVSDG